MTISRKIIEEAIQYISDQQQKDGGFTSFSSNRMDDFSDSITYNTNFITSVILEVLSNVYDTQLLYQVKKKASEFLLLQKSEQWSWNYWSKFSKEFTTMPYPDDLDDTFCALNALFLFDRKLIPGPAYAYIIQLLTKVEVSEGGPYKTWLVSKKTSGWDDVDVVVNSNITYFLLMQEVILPNLHSLFKERLKERNIYSPYYPTLYPFFYFLSRFYKDKKSIENILLTNRNKEGYWDNPLNTSLAVLALLKGKFPPRKLKNSIEYLLENRNNVHWQPYAFCIDPARKSKTYYAASPALTTAFCLAAISLFKKRTEEIKPQGKNSETNIYKKEIVNSKFFQFDDENLTEMGAKLLKKITAKEIPLMPFYFHQTLGRNGKAISKKDVILLGQANVLGWLAYTIYDDFLDEEGSPKLLPLANIYLRRLIHIYDTAFSTNQTVALFFHKILDIIEQANYWEITSCRLLFYDDKLEISDLKLPDYSDLTQLAYKSLGHGLGPLTMLLLLGYKEESEEFIALYNFFIDYLIAKQLHDDAHDWEEDLSKGHISFVVALILKKAMKKKIITKRKVVLKNIIPKLQKLFWYEIIEEVCSHIYDHVKKAQQELESSSIILNKNSLEDLLFTYRDGADKVLEERKKIIDFLHTY